MDNFKVSVIVPVYNCEEYIGNTIDSIINQDFEDYEIIVVNDGSTDGSLKIISEKLENSAIPHKVITQENAGVSVARNVAIEASSGDYLVFVDGDDYVSSNHLSNLYDGKSDFSLTQFVKKSGDNLSEPYVYSKDVLTTDEFIRMELNMEMPFNFFQIMYRASIIRDNNITFTPGTVYGEDTEFAHKALSFGDTIKVSNEVTYYYIQHEDSAINTTEFKRFDIIEIFENLAEFYRGQNRDDLSHLIITSRIPKAIFGNMNYFFYNSYDFDDVIAKMKELDLFTKLSKYEGDSKFKLKTRLFLSSPKLYYKMWKKFKNSID